MRLTKEVKMILVVVAIVLVALLFGSITGNVVKYSEGEDYFNKVWCKDADGQDVTKRGSTHYTTISGRKMQVYDTCGQIADPRYERSYVFESYCIGNNYHRLAMPCPVGTECMEGACR